MPPRYHLDDALFDTGERLPIICDHEAGGPLMRATLWALNLRRDKGRAEHTMQQDLASLAFSYA